MNGAAPAGGWNTVMHCEQAQRLFDAYLDGELAPTLATELGAHRLQCSDCRRALALLEVSEHILTLDQDPVSIDADFTDRLVACVQDSPRSWRYRLGRWLYVGGPVAAAAVIALAFLGVFDGRESNEVAGNRVVASIEDLVNMQDDAGSLIGTSTAAPLDGAGFNAQRSLEIKKRSVQSLQEAFDLTLQQPLDVLEQSRKKDTNGKQGSEGVAPRPSPAKPSGPAERSGEYEDL